MEHKKYKCGSKLTLVRTITSVITAGLKNAYNAYDANSLTPLLARIEGITGRSPERMYCDRCFCGGWSIFGEILKYQIGKRKALLYNINARLQAN